MLPTWFKVNKPFGSGEEVNKSSAKRGIIRPWQVKRCSTKTGSGMILAIFDLQVTLMLPTWFKVNKPFGSGEEVNKSSAKRGIIRPWQVKR